MINLAKYNDCDKIIKEELERAGVTDIVSIIPSGEVPSSIKGEISTIYGTITLTRAWRYWVAHGKIPLSIAEKIYAHPEGKISVRAGGHSGAVHPKEQVSYFDIDGRTLVKRSDLEMLGSDSKLYKDLINDKTYNFVDNPQEEGDPYVTTYHIDDAAGLLLFILMVKN